MGGKRKDGHGRRQRFVWFLWSGFSHVLDFNSALGGEYLLDYLPDGVESNDTRGLFGAGVFGFRF